MKLTVILVMCFMCLALIPPRRDWACTKCQEKLRQWPDD